VPNIQSLVWLGYLTHVLEDILAQHTRISLQIALLGPWSIFSQFGGGPNEVGSYTAFFSLLLTHGPNP
jgi:hypothetical protein